MGHLMVKVKGNVMNNKLFEMLDKLDSFVTTEEIGIDFIEVYNGKNELQIDIFSVPNNSFKLFSVPDIVVGYLYFDKDKNCVWSYRDEEFGNDDRKNKINKISVQYENGDFIEVRVNWNSLFYELDSGNSILLFMGERIIDDKRN